MLAIVGVNELTQVTRNAGGATKAYFTFFIAAGALYLALTLVSEVIITRIERWARRGMPLGRSALMAEVVLTNTTTRQRVLGWLQPHRVVLIAIALLIVAAAAYLPALGLAAELFRPRPAGHLAHHLAAGRDRCARASRWRSRWASCR